MFEDELKQRQKEFRQFGKILALRHRQNFAARRAGHESPEDARAQQLGRYLHAARTNAGLSAANAARRAQIPVGVLLALESGLVPSSQINRRWLQNLARVLREDPANFTLFLGDAPTSRFSRPQLAAWWRTLSINFQTRPMYASLSTVVLAVMLGVLFFINSDAYHLLPGSGAQMTVVRVTAQPTLPPAGNAQLSTLVDIGPADRLNLLNAETVRVSALPPWATINPAGPLNVSPDFDGESRELILAALQNLEPEQQIQVIRAQFDFTNRVLLLLALTKTTGDGRFNIARAEYGFERQILVLPKFVDVDAEERLNMTRAEIQL
ncbi:MAG: XRE family transcriptional regulator [Chloroflexi bacterium]|nr:MAG: XRE family transcriptional regulator [Chloroflexota bacterium]